MRYAGEYYDSELGFYYLRARYYDPKIGRFTSVDKVEPDIDVSYSMNRYIYCGNNPVMYSDPSGESLEGVTGVLGGAFNAALSAAMTMASAALGTISIVADIARYTKENEWKYDYHIAWLEGGYVQIGAQITFDEALERGLKGYSVYTFSADNAQMLAMDIGGGRLPDLPEEHSHGRPGYYWHFHPNPRNGSHVWFGLPIN